jgi:hypothetical protein
LLKLWSVQQIIAKVLLDGTEPANLSQVAGDCR